MGLDERKSFLPALILMVIFSTSLITSLGHAENSNPVDENQVFFTDISNITGLSEISTGSLFNWSSFGPGVSCGDYDGDGDLDLYVTVRHDHFGYEVREYFVEGDDEDLIEAAVIENSTGETFLLENRNGSFVDVSIASGVKLTNSTAIGSTWADYDGDGDLDLYVSNYGVSLWNITFGDGGEPNIMFSNNGDGTFTDVTNLSNLGNPGHSTGGLFVDYDHDGDLDVYSLNGGTYDELQYLAYAQSNILYRNDGDSNGDGVPEFSDQTIEAGRISGQDVNSQYDFVPANMTYSHSEASAMMEGDGTFGGNSGSGISWAGLWFDYNQDGWSDLFIASDFGISPLYENQKDGTFKLVTNEMGLNFQGTGMGAHSADINGDGTFEVCQTNFGPNYIWINNNGNYFDRFVDDGMSYEGKMTGVNWDCHFFDYDLDGDFDLFMTAGRINKFVSFQENSLYLNDGNGLFTDVTVDVGLGGHLKSMGASIADFDNDGDEDILVANSDGPLQLFQNNAAQVTGNHWLRVQLKGEYSNTYGIGVLVEAELDNGTILRQQTYAGSGFLGSGDPIVHFGIGSNEGVKEVRVHWTTGHIQTVSNISIDGTVTIFEEAPPETSFLPNIVMIIGLPVIFFALYFLFGNSIKSYLNKDELIEESLEQ